LNSFFMGIEAKADPLNPARQKHAFAYHTLTITGCVAIL
jgi:hypothetical protein